MSSISSVRLRAGAGVRVVRRGGVTGSRMSSVHPAAAGSSSSASSSGCTFISRSADGGDGYVGVAAMTSAMSMNGIACARLLARLATIHRVCGKPCNIATGVNNCVNNAYVCYLVAMHCNALQRALVAMVPILDAFATLQYGCNSIFRCQLQRCNRWRGG